MIRKREDPSRRIKLISIFLLIVYLLLGCSPAQSVLLYENSLSGLRLEKPSNWDLDFIERNGIIVLNAKNGVWKKVSTRIEIFGATCDDKPTGFNNSVEKLKGDINRIANLYKLESVTVIQEPRTIKTGDEEVVKTTIAIPTNSMKNDPGRIQVGTIGDEKYQIVEIFAIRGSDKKYLMAYIYKGDSDILNEQAQKIVDSIQRVCSSDVN